MRCSALALALICPALLAQASPSPLTVYSYLEPVLVGELRKAGISSTSLEDYTRRGLRERGIHAGPGGRVYEDSEDALRIDLRRGKGGTLLLELSVRQGASVHNMLERWAKARLVSGDKTQGALGLRLQDAISSLLDELAQAVPSPAYRQGHMMENE